MERQRGQRRGKDQRLHTSYDVCHIALLSPVCNHAIIDPQKGYGPSSEVVSLGCYFAAGFLGAFLLGPAVSVLWKQQEKVS